MFFVSLKKIDPSLYIEILTVQIFAFYSFYLCQKSFLSSENRFFGNFIKKKNDL